MNSALKLTGFVGWISYLHAITGGEMIVSAAEAVAEPAEEEAAGEICIKHDDFALKMIILH